MKQTHKITLIAITLLFTTAPVLAAKYKEGGVQNGGTLSGRVTLNGTAPAPEMLKVDEDVEACGGDRPSDALLVNGSGGIKNVVVSIEGVKSGKKWDFPSEFTYDQKGCSFVPRVMLIAPRTAGEILNSDSIGHNFHTISKGIFNINKKIQAGASLKVKNNKIRKAGMVRAKCDIHSWMGGWWVVAETPYTVLSDEDGKYSITDLPAGSYKLKIWHETLGESEQQIEIKAGETTQLDVALKI